VSGHLIFNIIKKYYNRKILFPKFYIKYRMTHAVI